MPNHVLTSSLSYGDFNMKKTPTSSPIGPLAENEELRDKQIYIYIWQNMVCKCYMDHG